MGPQTISDTSSLLIPKITQRDLTEFCVWRIRDALHSCAKTWLLPIYRSDKDHAPTGHPAELFRNCDAGGEKPVRKDFTGRFFLHW